MASESKTVPPPPPISRPGTADWKTAPLHSAVAHGITPYATTSLDLVEPGDEAGHGGTPRDALEAVPVANVLILYAGGTIGMAHTSRGFAPVRGALQEAMLKNPCFQDPTQPPCTTPVTAMGKRIRYTVKEYDPLLDSCNMTHKDWARLATDIYDNYDDYEAFLVLHGTDTMAFTASVLSFMLPSINKSVIVTGSQIPLSLQRNDGVGNLLGALIMAGHYVIPEVCLYFHNKLMRGNRTTKADSAELDAFMSPNFMPLVNVGVEIHVKWEHVLPRPVAPLELQTAFDPNVVVLSLYPGLSPDLLASMMRPPMRGVVLRTFGAGNAPDQSPEFLRVIKEACDNGVVIVNVTQCLGGGVAAHYATGVALYEAGVVSGSDLTVEAALTKLGFLLGQGHRPHRVKELMVQSLHGELTVPEESPSKRFTMDNASFIRSVYRAMSQGANDPDAELHQRMISKALLPVLLCSAGGRGDLSQLRSMVADGADVDAADYDGRTALHLAASEGHSECVQFLIDSGCLLSPIDRWKGTPYHDAVRHGHDDVAKLLAAAGATVAVVDLSAQLVAAASCGDLPSVKMLVESDGADVNQPDFDGRRPLHHAAANGHLEVVRHLLSVGARANIADRHGVSALEASQANGHRAVMETLQASGATTLQSMPGAMPSPTPVAPKRVGQPRGKAAAAKSRLGGNTATAAVALMAGAGVPTAGSHSKPTAGAGVPTAGSHSKPTAGAGSGPGGGRTPAAHSIASAEGDTPLVSSPIASPDDARSRPYNASNGQRKTSKGARAAGRGGSGSGRSARGTRSTSRSPIRTREKRTPAAAYSPQALAAKAGYGGAAAAGHARTRGSGADVPGLRGTSSLPQLSRPPPSASPATKFSPVLGRGRAGRREGSVGK